MNFSLPKISIIIPVYNVERYLDCCIQSVVNQTLSDIEIILVDDESPDACPLMCDEYAKQDKRIKVLHKKNGGLGFARNSGLEVATGEYVTFLDSDDIVDLCTYEHLCNLLTEHNLDVLYYNFRRFVSEDEIKEEISTNNVLKYEKDGIHDLMLDMIASEPSAKVDHKIQCSSCTAIYRLDIIQKHNIRSHSERELISEDLIFNLDFLKYTQSVGFNSGAHYHYRINPTSLTSTVRIDRIEKHSGLYHYIISNLSYWGIDESEGKLRAKRLFIGCSRSSICQLMSSNMEENKKKELFSMLVSLNIWKEVADNYPLSKLPLYPKMFYRACISKSYYITKKLYQIKKIR